MQIMPDFFPQAPALYIDRKNLDCTLCGLVPSIPPFPAQPDTKLSERLCIDCVRQNDKGTTPNSMFVFQAKYDHIGCDKSIAIHTAIKMVICQQTDPAAISASQLQFDNRLRRI